MRHHGSEPKAKSVAEAPHKPLAAAHVQNMSTFYFSVYFVCTNGASDAPRHQLFRPALLEIRLAVMPPSPRPHRDGQSEPANLKIPSTDSCWSSSPRTRRRTYYPHTRPDPAHKTSPHSNKERTTRSTFIHPLPPFSSLPAASAKREYFPQRSFDIHGSVARLHSTVSSCLNHSWISRCADSGESEAWTRFRPVVNFRGCDETKNFRRNHQTPRAHLPAAVTHVRA